MLPLKWGLQVEKKRNKKVTSGTKFCPEPEARKPCQSIRKAKCADGRKVETFKKSLMTLHASQFVVRSSLSSTWNIHFTFHILSFIPN